MWACSNGVKLMRRTVRRAAGMVLGLIVWAWVRTFRVVIESKVALEARARPELLEQAIARARLRAQSLVDQGRPIQCIRGEA